MKVVYVLMAIDYNDYFVAGVYTNAHEADLVKQNCEKKYGETWQWEVDIVNLNPLEPYIKIR